MLPNFFTSVLTNFWVTPVTSKVYSLSCRILELKISTSIKFLKMNQPQALIAYEGRPTAEVEAILNQVVSKGTQGNYINHNMDLILWIYEQEDWREELLKDWMVERLNRVEEKGRKEMRASCKEALKAINKSEDKRKWLSTFLHITWTSFSNWLWWNKKCTYSFISNEWERDGGRI